MRTSEEDKPLLQQSGDGAPTLPRYVRLSVNACVESLRELPHVQPLRRANHHALHAPQ